MATQAERRERTRAAIVAAGTELFVERGYVATTVADILREADVSRGAMYHHFDSKEAVFEAVFVETSTEAIRRAKSRSKRSDTPLATLRSGCLAWVEIATEPRIATILFAQGPVALGWQRCRELEDAASLEVVRNGLRAAAAAGEVDAGDIEMDAQLLNAILAEAALSIHSGRPGSSRAAARRSISRVISGFAAPAG